MSRRTRADPRAASLFPRPADDDAPPGVLAGVDEAGFGPMLGPLTIGCVALRSKAGAVDPWLRLARVVARADERDERLCVGDSKAVFERNPAGRARLERTVLAFHAALHGVPAHGRAFLAATAPPLACADLDAEPWHASIPERLESGACAGLDADVAALSAALLEAQLALATCSVRAVPPSTLNASFERTASKGATHWEECRHFFLHLWRDYAQDGVELVVDRHGGRMRYAGLLAATFPEATVEVESETPERSVYRLRGPGGRRLRATFAEKADALSFPVALASCCAKYARELCMDAFNAHFARFQPGLAPTAGYYNDARRWLDEAAPALALAGLDRTALVRTR